MAVGLSISSTSNMSTGQKILLRNAKVAEEPSAPGPDLITQDTMPTGHKQRDVLTYARLGNANALTEGVDLAQIEQLVTASLSLTPTEHGILATLSKRLVDRQGDSNVIAVTGQLLGRSLGRRQDLDIITLFDSATKSVGGATITGDITYFRGSVAYLLTDNDSAYGPAPMPIVADLHIEQISDLVADLSDPGAVVSSRFGLSAEMLQRWWRGTDRLYSVQVFHGGNITRSSNASKGAIFNSDAMVYVDAAGSDDVTEDPDPSHRITEYGAFQTWAEGIRSDPWMVEYHTNSAATV